MANNTILETLKSIDQRQKETIIDGAGCISCDNALIAAKYNTIPVTLTLCEIGPYYSFFNATSSARTRVFRVEEVIDCDAVKLRLIKEKKDPDNQDNMLLKCTDQTCIVSIDCISCLQCFTPINCDKCKI